MFSTVNLSVRPCAFTARKLQMYVLHLLHAACAGADSEEGQLQIELPAVLQKQLLDQYEAVHDEKKLLQLPRRPNVMQV